MPETKRKCSSLAYFQTVPPLILTGTFFFFFSKEKRERDNCEYRKIMEDLDYYSNEKRGPSWKGT